MASNENVDVIEVLADITKDEKSDDMERISMEEEEDESLDKYLTKRDTELLATERLLIKHNDSFIGDFDMEEDDISNFRDACILNSHSELDVRDISPQSCSRNSIEINTALDSVSADTQSVEKSEKSNQKLYKNHIRRLSHMIQNSAERTQNKKFRMAVIGVALGLVAASMLIVATALSMSSHIDDMVRQQAMAASSTPSGTAPDHSTSKPLTFINSTTSLHEVEFKENT